MIKRERERETLAQMDVAPYQHSIVASSEIRDTYGVIEGEETGFQTQDVVIVV